jgi:hypothetical protein
VTGRLSDTLGRKPLIVGGMLVQAAAFPAALWLPGGPLAASIRSVVVFPAPFGPRNPVTSPGAALKLSPSTAVTRSNRFVRPETTIRPASSPIVLL